MAAYQFDLITLFPEFFKGPLDVGLVGRAFRDHRAEIRYINPREFARDRHRTVDDAPYGGGAGMVMKVEPLAEAIQTARGRGQGPVVMLSPQGRALEQADLRRWGQSQHLVLVCGRYEGFDERVRPLVDEEISLGDFVLTGGEYGALTIIDGVVRLLPGTLGNEVSAATDSFADGLLEHPQYTRPDTYAQSSVPEVLLSGNHARIRAWRQAMQIRRTWTRRPDLLEEILIAKPYGIDGLARYRGDIRLTVGPQAETEEARIAGIAEAYGIEDYRCLSDEENEGFWAERFPADTLRVIVDHRPMAPVIGPKKIRKALQIGRSVSLGIDLGPRCAEYIEGEHWVLPPPGQWLNRGLSGAEKVAVLLDRVCGEL